MGSGKFYQNRNFESRDFISNIFSKVKVRNDSRKLSSWHLPQRCILAMVYIEIISLTVGGWGLFYVNITRKLAKEIVQKAGAHNYKCDSWVQSLVLPGLLSTVGSGP